MPKNRTRAPGLADWQPRAGRFTLKDIDPGATPWSAGDKEADRAATERLAAEIDELQERFHADGRHALLVVLQGTDTSGKDGTARAVFARTSPVGVRTVSWRAPSEEERAHDFLWRIHRAAPARGEIVVFNRSHYEEVIVPVVDGTVRRPEAARRYRQINDFERMLAENGTVVLKFMLHISRDRQREQLQERLDDPTKRWKLHPEDLDAQRRWKAEQKAYQSLLRATSSAHAPWTIVPADRKTHRNLMVASLVRDALRRLEPRYPPADPAIAGMKIR